ncbi:MAG: hypothetical protein AAFX06_34330, partial [Planctomycetota bacterium]
MTQDEYTEKDLREHEIVRNIIDGCAAATRRWVNGEVTNDYLVLLSGLAGSCIAVGKHRGLAGHELGTEESIREANHLIARLTEVREVLRYPQSAAATLESTSSL